MQGRMYWQKEQHICSQLAQQAGGSEQRLTTGCFTLEDLHTASEAKSFDYRLLHHLLFRLQGQQPDRRLLQFLFLDEHLVDIGDDLHDYEARFSASPRHLLSLG